MESATLEATPHISRRHHLEGTSVSFFHYCEWFEVNVHDAIRMSPEDVVKLLRKFPKTRLDNSNTDDYGAVRWYGGAWVDGHHVRVWYNPQALIERDVLMHIHKNGHEIRSVDEWFRRAPPKRGAFHWKDNHSAKELARSWFRSGTAQVPAGLKSVLISAFGSDGVVEEGIPECAVGLDDFNGETRNCDLVIVGKVGARRMVISVEAKADAGFRQRYGG